MDGWRWGKADVAGELIFFFFFGENLFPFATAAPNCISHYNHRD